MSTGRVIRFDDVRGYGFIAQNSGGEDVFLHANEVTDRGIHVSTGTHVEFQMMEGERGLKAYDVRVIDDGRSRARSAAVATVNGVSADTLNGSANHNDGESSGPAAEAPVIAEDELCEVFSNEEFRRQITELLLAAAPQATAATIAELRDQLAQFARNNGWIE